METHGGYCAITGVAWPSSVRVLKCSLKWGNERNPRRLLQVSVETASPIVFNYMLNITGGEEGEDDARSA